MGNIAIETPLWLGAMPVYEHYGRAAPPVALPVVGLWQGIQLQARLPRKVLIDEALQSEQNKNMTTASQACLGTTIQQTWKREQARTAPYRHKTTPHCAELSCIMLLGVMHEQCRLRRTKLHIESAGQRHHWGLGLKTPGLQRAQPACFDVMLCFMAQVHRVYISTR